MPGNTILLLALVPVTLWYLYTLAVRKRYKDHGGLSVVPRTLLWGAGKTIAEAYRKGDLRRHADYVFYEIAKSMGLPPLLVFDLRPLYWEVCIITSHDVAEQVSKTSKMFPYSVSKSPTMSDILPLIGQQSMICAEDEVWKASRKRYNAGFAPQHLMTLLPRILEKTKLFVGRLDDLARSGQPAKLDQYCIDLTFDIIGAVVMDIDFNAQLPREQQDELVRYYRDLVDTYTDTGGAAGITLNPFMSIRRKRLCRLTDKAIKAAVREKFAEVKEKRADKKYRSVLALSLQDTDELTDDVLQSTNDVLKSFLFAGHDTTSILLQWAFYELSRNPRALETLRAELDAVFGADADADSVINQFLTRGEDVVQRLSFTSAVIKEILRLYPPAGTARRSPPGRGLFVRLPDGQSVCVDGLVLYSCHYIIQRDPKVFGDTADDFVPERWLGDTDTSQVNEIPETGAPTASDKRLPPSAWRPFERGPRNCIGQELANLEARVILAVTMRRYDFIKVGAGQVLRDEKGLPVKKANGHYEVQSELFNMRQVTAKPYDGMVMQLKLRERGY